MQDVSKIYTTQVLLHYGNRRYLEAPAGWRLTEVLRYYGVPIKAECGGACACATCHIHIQQEGQPALRAPNDDERLRLDELFDADHRSRLSCQILTGP